MLNKEEIKRYHEDGYIIPEFKMPENDLLEIEKLHDELIKKNPQFLKNIFFPIRSKIILIAIFNFIFPKF